METEPGKRSSTESDELAERKRREVIKAIEPYGMRPASALSLMSEHERTKWLFWNLHENLDELRALEPVLVGQIIRVQLTVSDGQSMAAQGPSVAKRAEFSCKWQLAIKQSAYESQQSFSISEGWVDLYVGAEPPLHPPLRTGQKGYLDADSPLHPNQLLLYGWISECFWQEIKPQVFNASANCHTDVYLRDDFLFPVKSGVDFVTGPTGSIGLTNFEFRTASQPRMTSWVRS